MRRLLAVITLTLVSSASLVYAQSQQAFRGVVTDSMCGAHHMMSNVTAAQCTRECLKRGADAALQSGDKLYTLKGDKAQFDKWAGQSVTVEGKLSGTNLTVEAITGSSK
jgi:hypothetical protein